MRHFRVWSLAAAALLTGCAASGPRAPQITDDVQYAQGQQVDRICFARSIDGFGEATDHSVVVFKRPNERYLLKTAGLCQDLDEAWSLSLVSFGGCLVPGDSIRVQRFPPGVPESALSGGRCRIRSIHEWAARGDTGEM